MTWLIRNDMVELQGYTRVRERLAAKACASSPRCARAHHFTHCSNVCWRCPEGSLLRLEHVVALSHCECTVVARRRQLPPTVKHHQHLSSSVHNSAVSLSHQRGNNESWHRYDSASHFHIVPNATTLLAVDGSWSGRIAILYDKLWTQL